MATLIQHSSSGEVNPQPVHLNSKGQGSPASMLTTTATAAATATKPPGTVDTKSPYWSLS